MEIPKRPPPDVGEEPQWALCNLPPGMFGFWRRVPPEAPTAENSGDPKRAGWTVTRHIEESYPFRSIPQALCAVQQIARESPTWIFQFGLLQWGGPTDIREPMTNG